MVRSPFTAVQSVWPFATPADMPPSLVNLANSRVQPVLQPVAEAALAHSLGNSTEQAYARSDLFERRRALMQQWADFLTG